MSASMVSQLYIPWYCSSLQLLAVVGGACPHTSQPAPSPAGVAYKSAHNYLTHCVQVTVGSTEMHCTEQIF